MSNSTCYRKRYRAPVMSEPSDREKRIANRLANGCIDNSEYYKALYEKRIAEKHARKSASPDTENEDPFFKAMRKVHERSTYGMHTIYEPKQLTIDDMLNEHSNK